MDKIRYINKRFIMYGQYLDIYEYEKPVLVGYTARPVSAPPLEKKASEKRNDNIYRSRTALRRLVNANPQLTKFLTLTFAPVSEKRKHKKAGYTFNYVDNLTDFDQTNYHFKKFRQKLCYMLPNNRLSYIAVPEFQKSGNVHYHLLADLPYVPASEIATKWSAGFVKINKLSTVSNVGAYVSKYLTKERSENYHLNSKAYFHSLDLQKPIEVSESITGGMRLHTEKSISYLSDYFGTVKLTVNKIINLGELKNERYFEMQNS